MRMRFLEIGAMLAATTCAWSQTNLEGHWVGHIEVDRTTLLKKAVLPLHRKLLLYTADRLEKSTVTLDFSTGAYRWHFDDGYLADRENSVAQWRTEGEKVFLSHFRGSNGEKKLTYAPSDQTLHTLWHGIDGVRIAFRRSN